MLSLSHFANMDQVSDAALRPYVSFTVWLGLGVLLLGIVAVLS